MSSTPPTSILSGQPPNCTRTDPQQPEPSKAHRQLPVTIGTATATSTTLRNENRAPAGQGHLNPCSTLSIAYSKTSPREREPVRQLAALEDHHQLSTTLPCQSHPIIANAVKRRRMSRSSGSSGVGKRADGGECAQAQTTSTSSSNSTSGLPASPAMGSSGDNPGSPYLSPVPHCRKRARLPPATPAKIISPRVQCPTTGKTGRWQWVEEDPSEYASGDEDDELEGDEVEDAKPDVESLRTESHSAGLDPAHPLVHGGSPLNVSTIVSDPNQRETRPSFERSETPREESGVLQPAVGHVGGELSQPVSLETKVPNHNLAQPSQREMHTDQDQPSPSRPIALGWSPDSPEPALAGAASRSEVRRPSLSPPSRPVLQYHPSERQVTVHSQLEISRGTELLATEPAYSVLETGLLKSHCSGCMISVRAKAEMLGMSVPVTRQSFETCPTCKQCIFCDYCFEGRGLKHRMECKILAQPESGDLPSSECRLLMKLFMSDQSRLKDLPDFSPPWRPTLAADERKILKELDKWWPTRNRKAYEAGEHGPIHDTRPSIDQQVKGLRRMRTCLFPMYDSERYLIGYGLYSDLARFNHDCDPNAQIVYPFDSMGKRFTRLIATRDIDNGEETTISYCDIDLPVHWREPILSKYGFYGLKRHICQFCDSNTVDPRWAIYHPGCKAVDPGLVSIIDVQPGQSVNPPPCTECGQEGVYSPQSKAPVILPGTPMWPIYELESSGRLFSRFETGTTNDGSNGSGSEPDTPLIRESTVNPETEPEVHSLFKYLDWTAKVMPKTVHPLPILQRRAARLFAENRFMSLATCKIIIAHLHEALFAYDTISTSAASPISCAIYVTALQTRVAQLSAIAATRPLLPRLQQLRETSAKGSRSSRNLRHLVWVTKGEAEEAEDMLDAVYRECKGDLWERYLKVKMDLEILLKIVDPTKR